jgi:hypothetical protein
VSNIYRRVWRSLSGPDVITRICSAQYYCQTPPSLSPQDFRTYYWHAADAGPGRTGESHTKGHIECARDCGASGCSGGARASGQDREREARQLQYTIAAPHTGWCTGLWVYRPAYQQPWVSSWELRNCSFNAQYEVRRARLFMGHGKGPLGRENEQMSAARCQQCRSTSGLHS